MSAACACSKKIYLGDGGDPEMLAAIRAHGNLMEFAPLCLLLIYLRATSTASGVTAGLSVVLLIARVLHAGGMLGFIPLGRFLGAEPARHRSWRSSRSCSSSPASISGSSQNAQQAVRAMGEPVTVPLWLFLAIALFALWSLLDRLLIPSGRWFLRRRLNRLIDRVNHGSPSRSSRSSSPSARC